MRLPNDTQRHAIYGQTGSGKTVAGLWALERRAFLKRPWVIVDTKRDPTIKRIPRLEEIGLKNPPPKQAGLYVVRPTPGEDDLLEGFMWSVWHREKTGLFFDEGAAIARFSKAFKALLTQGRSKRIPIIGLSQRPSWLSPWFMSEMDFHQVLHVQNPADVARLEEWIPGLQPTRRDYHSQYYDVADNDLTYLRPVPNEDEILNRFDRKMPRRVKLFSNLAVNTRASKLRKAY